MLNVVVVVKTGLGNTTEITQYLADYVSAENGNMNRTHSRRVTASPTAKRVVEEFEYRLGQGLGCVVLDEYMTAESIKYKSEGILHRERLVNLDVRH